jgi:hypothetical protein
MWGEGALFGPSGRGSDHIRKWYIFGKAAKTSSFPLAQIVLHSSFAGLAKKTPRFPCGARHNRYFRELLMRVLGSIAAPKSLNEADNLSALFKPVLHKRNIDEVGEQWVRRDEHMATWNQDSQSSLRKLGEESPKVAALLVGENCESR